MSGDQGPDNWAFKTETSEFVIDVRGGNVWRDGELINSRGLTINRHFRVLRLLLKKSPATVSYDELKEGIGRDNQAVYDVVTVLRKKLGQEVILTEPGRGYALAGTAKPVQLPHDKIAPNQNTDAGPRSVATLATPEVQPAREAVTESVATDAASRKPTPGSLGSLAGFWGGEGRICGTVSVSYGAMVGLALLVEVAYRWPEFAYWVVPASAIAALSSAVVAALTFGLMRRRAASGRSDSVSAAAGILSFWSLLVALSLAWWLPDEPITQATFQTMTARVGWSKSVLEGLALPILSLVPVQVVFALRHRLSSGRAEEVYRLLTDDRTVAVLPGTVLPGARVSTVVFAVVTIWWMAANAYLLHNLKGGPYYGLFLELNVIRVSTGLITLLVVLYWYLQRREGLKHEAMGHNAPRTSPASPPA